MTYRVKQVGDKFYPQGKKRFSWYYYKGRPYMTYDCMLEKIVAFEDLFFTSFEDANNFLIKQKHSDTTTYHEIKN